MLITILTALARNKGWLYELFAAVRADAIGVASASVKLAMGVASLIIVFKMIRLAYDIMSDEQTSGFGGVRLWQILRPVVILLLIQSCTVWVGALDSLTNVVTVSITRSIDALGDKDYVVKMLTEDEMLADGLSVDEIKSTGVKAREDYKAKMERWKRWPIIGPIIAWASESLGGEKKAEKRALKELTFGLLKDPERDGDALRQSINDYVNASKHAEVGADGEYHIDIHDNNFVPMVCNWLYDNFYIVVQCVAELMLMILAMCCPWALVISLLEPWKTAVWTFITTYVQISFWKVVAAMINFATISMRRTTIVYAMDHAATNMKQAVAGGQLTAVGSTKAAITLSAILSVAGIFCLLKIERITAGIIPSASNLGSESGGGSTAVSSTGIKAMTSAAKKIGSAIVGKVKSNKESKQRQKENGKLAKDIGKSVGQEIMKNAGRNGNRNKK